METSFYLDICIQTSNGPRRTARFELGNDRTEARQLFQSLKGSPEMDGKGMLYMEFTEIVNGLPLNIEMLTCDLQQLGTNCMLITQELFRRENIRPGK